MSNYDEDRDVFDGAEDDDEEEGSRLPVLIVIALLVLAAFAGVVWLAYSQGVARGHGEVTASNQSGAPTAGDIVKPYEQPAPSDEDADATTAGPTASSEPSAAPSSSEPASAPATAPSEPAVTATQTPKPPAVHPSETPRLTTPPPQERVAAKPTPTPPAPKPAAVNPAPPQQVATAAPRQITAPEPAAPPPSEPKPTASAPAPAATGVVALQIGAYKSQAEADGAWTAYKGKHAAAVGAYGPSTVKVDLGAKGTWYRLRMGPFSSRADALAVCDKLKADGASCFLAK